MYIMHCSKVGSKHAEIHAIVDVYLIALGLCN